MRRLAVMIVSISITALACSRTEMMRAAAAGAPRSARRPRRPGSAHIPAPGNGERRWLDFLALPIRPETGELFRLASLSAGSPCPSHVRTIASIIDARIISLADTGQASYVRRELICSRSTDGGILRKNFGETGIFSFICA